MPITDVLRNINLFVDGRGYAGKVEELNLPKLECDFSTSGVAAEVLKLWGVGPGTFTPFTFRGAVQSEDGSVKSVEVRVRGVVKEIDWGTWKPGEKAPLKAMIALRYYQLTHDGTVIHEIDVGNMIRTINGTDQLAAQRAALGI